MKKPRHIKKNPKMIFILKQVKIFSKFSFLNIQYISNINVENVVKPPQIPIEINKNISFFAIEFLSQKAINKPIIKHPTKLETEVPIGKVIKFLLEYFVTIYLIELPIPPPKKTRIKDFKSKTMIIN